MARCVEYHWFSTDPPGTLHQCVLGANHVPRYRHEDLAGRWWECWPMQLKHSLQVTCSQCTDAVEIVGGTSTDLPFVCPRCRKQLFAEAILEELEGLGEGALPFTEAALVFTEKVKEWASHFRLSLSR